MKLGVLVALTNVIGRPPHGGRGLKSLAVLAGFIRGDVAPHTGGVG